MALPGSESRKWFQTDNQKVETNTMTKLTITFEPRPGTSAQEVQEALTAILILSCADFGVGDYKIEPELPNFRVQKVNLKNVWTVIEAGKGGDHHWLSKELALAAKDVYQVLPFLHGVGPDLIEAEYNKLGFEDSWPSVKIIDVEPQ